MTRQIQEITCAPVRIGAHSRCEANRPGPNKSPQPTLNKAFMANTPVRPYLHTRKVSCWFPPVTPWPRGLFVLENNG